MSSERNDRRIMELLSKASSSVTEPAPAGADDRVERARAILAGEYDPPPAAA